MTRTIWLARHANRLDFVYPEWFELAERRYDPPLAEDGFIQADNLAKRLQGEGIEHIFCSPFLRAIQTAYPLAISLDLPLKIEAGLGEWLNPEWMTECPQIHPPYLLEKDYPHINWEYRSHCIPEYPESLEQVQLRSALTACNLVAQFSGNLFLVGHSTSILGATEGLVGKNLQSSVPRLLKSGLADDRITRLKLGFACPLKLVKSGKQWQIELEENCTLDL